MTNFAILGQSTRLILLALAYFVAGWLGLKIPYSGSHITLVWLPSGIAVAALFRWGWAVCPGVYLGAFLVNLAIGSAWPLAAAIAVGNTLGPLLTTRWLKRVKFHPEFDRKSDVGVFVIAASMGMAITAFLGVLSLYWFGLTSLEAASSATVYWWMGDTVGILLATPFLLTLNRKNIEQLISAGAEFFVWLLVAGTTGWLAFIYNDELMGNTLPIAFLTMPLLAWSGLRFGNTGAAIAGFGFSLLAVWGSATGRGAFLLSDHHINLFLLWVYMATTVLMGLLVTALQTERRQIEISLRASQDRLNEAQHIAHVGSWSLNLVTGELIWSNEIFRLFEIDPQHFQATYEGFLNAIHPEDREAVNQAYIASLENGEIYEIPHRLLMSDGRIKWVLERGTSEFDAAGKAFRSHGTVQDITERKQAEEALRIAAVTFETHEAIMITDAEATILRVNNAFERITGFGADEVVGKNPRLLRSGHHEKGFYKRMWQHLLTVGTWEGEIWDRRKSGQVYPKWLTVTALKDSQGKTTEYVAIFSDITDRKQAEEAIHNLAFYDPLTKLPNRRLLQDRFNLALLASERSKHFGAVLFLDMDKFKTLNDTLGHNIGDLMLIEVAERTKRSVREVDTVARFGGDEFAVLLEDMGSSAEDASTKAAVPAEKIRQALALPFYLKDHVYHSSSSIGVCLYYGHTVPVDNLIKQADIAMYQAKNAGRNTVRFFDPALQQALEIRSALELDLRCALSARQLHLYYQIQMDSDGFPVGAEALIRWIHPERGMISPAQFIPIAEESALILEIGHWVLDTACRQLAAWHRNELTRKLLLAVNVSARQFMMPDFVASVEAVVRAHNIVPSSLKLELTESVILNDVTDIVAKMNALKALGVKLSLDDFGTGYSSLSYLKQLPIDQIKIDQSFVRDIVSDPNDAVMVQTIIQMAKNFSLNVIAEGVETEEQLNFLKKQGCLAFQGYYFSKPIPIDEFEQLLS